MTNALDEIKSTFDLFDDWEDKYRFLIELGKDLPALAAPERSDEHLVRGCQSQVWLLHNWCDEKIQLRIDSEAHIVRGLASIVLAALNERTAQEIIGYDIEGLFSELQLLQHLSPTRGNGLRAMVGRIQNAAHDHLGGSSNAEKTLH